MKGSRPGKLPAPSQTTHEGRTCDAPGCTTRLSIYNLDSRCWQHAGLTFPNYRGKRLSDERA
ncbi:MAG TPA: hypothetical protein VEN82_04065 [Actinomycetota bacterium]|nr:hypothetical protein [Actinomycetota bacterium]